MTVLIVGLGWVGQCLSVAWPLAATTIRLIQTGRFSEDL